jgi:hypothetical protein
MKWGIVSIPDHSHRSVQFFPDVFVLKELAKCCGGSGLACETKWGYGRAKKYKYKIGNHIHYASLRLLFSIIMHLLMLTPIPRV